MTIALKNWNIKTDGILTRKAMERKIVRLGYAVSCYTYPPGTFFEEHKHGQDKADGVLSGRFEVTMKEKKFLLTAGDIIFIPKGILHSAKVIGEEPVISLDGVHR